MITILSRIRSLLWSLFFKILNWIFIFEILNMSSVTRSKLNHKSSIDIIVFFDLFCWTICLKESIYYVNRTDILLTHLVIKKIGPPNSGSGICSSINEKWRWRTYPIKELHVSKRGYVSSRWCTVKRVGNAQRWAQLVGRTPRSTWMAGNCPKIKIQLF